jgi:hypothetical protein
LSLSKKIIQFIGAIPDLNIPYSLYLILPSLLNVRGAVKVMDDFDLLQATETQLRQANSKASTAMKSIENLLEIQGTFDGGTMFSIVSIFCDLGS